MRGEWIEIFCSSASLWLMVSLPMRGEWIEIASHCLYAPSLIGLSPCGESGLKYGAAVIRGVVAASLPMRGEWIEIAQALSAYSEICLSPCGESGLKLHPQLDDDHVLGLSPCGESGLKSLRHGSAGGLCESLPMRGEWIEMMARTFCTQYS